MTKIYVLPTYVSLDNGIHQNSIIVYAGQTSWNLRVLVRNQEFAVITCAISKFLIKESIYWGRQLFVDTLTISGQGELIRREST